MQSFIYINFLPEANTEIIDPNGNYTWAMGTPNITLLFSVTNHTESGVLKWTHSGDASTILVLACKRDQSCILLSPKLPNEIHWSVEPQSDGTYLVIRFNGIPEYNQSSIRWNGSSTSSVQISIIGEIVDCPTHYFLKTHTRVQLMPIFVFSSLIPRNELQQFSKNSDKTSLDSKHFENGSLRHSRQR